MDNTLEGYEKLKSNGFFDIVDDEVYMVIERHERIDAYEAYAILNDERVSYNLVQQAFTRLKKQGKIFKVGTHKGSSGFTRGIYSVNNPEEKNQMEMF